MTRAVMPGRAHLQSVPACSMAEDLSAEERALLAELGVATSAPPALHLVPKAALAPDPREDAPLRQPVLGFLAIVITAAAIACAALTSLLGHLDGLTP